MHLIPEFMGMREGWLHFERPSVCSLFDYSSEQMQTDRKIKTWNWPTTYTAQREWVLPQCQCTYNIFLLICWCWLWLAFIGIFADTWKISSYQWSTCPGHWLSAPLLPPSLSLGFCLPSSGILWCSIMVSSILKKYSFFIFLRYAWINLKCYKNKSCLVLDAWCAMCCILSAHSEGQKLITANFFA